MAGSYSPVSNNRSEATHDETLVRTFYSDNLSH